MRRHGFAALAPRAEAQDAYVAGIDARTQGTVWLTGCTSWYIDATGRDSRLWPGTSWSFRRRLARFRLADYETTTALPRPGGGTTAVPPAASADP